MCLDTLTEIQTDTPHKTVYLVLFFGRQFASSNLHYRQNTSGNAVVRRVLVVVGGNAVVRRVHVVVGGNAVVRRVHDLCYL